MSNLRPNYNPTNFLDDYGRFNQLLNDFLKLNLWTATPVRVKEVNNNLVNVLPVIELLNTNNEVIEITDDDIITGIPIMMLFGGLTEISFNVSINDFGLLIACKYDISNFVKTRETNKVASNRLFNLSNGFYLPFDFKQQGTGIVIKNNTSIINITETEINITAENVNINGFTNIGGSGGAFVLTKNTIIKDGENRVCTITGEATKVKAL